MIQYLYREQEMKMSFMSTKIWPLKTQKNSMKQVMKLQIGRYLTLQ